VFSDQEYEELLAELDQETSAADEDDAPDVPETPVTVAGDLWIDPGKPSPAVWRFPRYGEHR
jgi:hypothetical protein